MNPLPITVEACVTSVEEVTACFAAGAKRAELCRDLDVGGLTPEFNVVAAALKAAPGEVFVLVRPGAGSFRLASLEIDVLVKEVASVATLGVHGIVVGVLNKVGKIDRIALEELISAASGLPVTFHRAFDQVENPFVEIQSLIAAGVERVLTSGGAPTAWEGREVLRKLVAGFSDQITVLGAGGIREEHVRELVEETGLIEVHARASAIVGVVRGLHDAKINIQDIDNS